MGTQFHLILAVCFDDWATQDASNDRKRLADKLEVGVGALGHWLNNRRNISADAAFW